ncbi:MAG: transposase [Bacteroidetes bacterium]|nr:transposase [Bacteroidota bacterium]
MAKAYSIDLRTKIIEAYKNGEGSMRKLAKRFKVSAYFVFTLLKQFRQTGQFSPKPHGGGRRPAIETQGQSFIKNLLNDQPDLILEEICAEYNKHFEPVTRFEV